MSRLTLYLPAILIVSRSVYCCRKAYLHFHYIISLHFSILHRALRSQNCQIYNISLSTGDGLSTSNNVVLSSWARAKVYASRHGYVPVINLPRNMVSILSFNIHNARRMIEIWLRHTAPIVKINGYWPLIISQKNICPIILTRLKNTH